MFRLAPPPDISETELVERCLAHDQPLAYQDKKGQYFTNKFWRAYRQEYTLVKIGFMGIPTSSARYEAAIEQKLAAAWSIGISFGAYHRRTSDIIDAQMGGAVIWPLVLPHE